MANPFEGIPAYPPQRDQESPLAAFFQRLQAAKQAKDLEEQRARAMMAQKAMEMGQQRELKEAELSQEAKLRGRGLDIEQQRANQMGRGGHGAIPAEDFNRLVGEEAFAPGTMVTPQMRIAFGFGKKNQQLPAKSAEMIANLESGKDSINVMRRILGGPKGALRKAKAGTFGARLWSIGDTEAQDLGKAAGEAADVLTRARTGAALNKDEQDYYGRLFLSVLDTEETTKRALDRYEKLFDETQALMKQGRGGTESKTAFLGRLSGSFKGGSGAGPEQAVGQDDYVPILDPQGRRGRVPKSKFAEKLKQGFRPVQ